MRVFQMSTRRTYFPTAAPLFPIGRSVCWLNKLCGDFQSKQRMDEDADRWKIYCLLLQMLAGSVAFLSASICVKGVLHYNRWR